MKIRYCTICKSYTLKMIHCGKYTKKAGTPKPKLLFSFYRYINNTISSYK